MEFNYIQIKHYKNLRKEVKKMKRMAVHNGIFHADDVFGSWGMETTKKYTEAELKDILAELVNADEYGVVLRAKGIVMSANDGEWLHFNYVPGESSVAVGAADYTGRFCVIGSKLQEHSLQELFVGE